MPLRRRAGGGSRAAAPRRRGADARASRPLDGRSVRGEDHREYHDGVHELARLYVAAERYEEAVPRYLASIEGMRRLRGEEHMYTLTTEEELAQAYQKLARYDDAETLLLDALEIRRRTAGRAAPKTLRTLGYLSEHYKLSGQSERRREIVRELLTLRRAAAENPEADAAAKDDYARLLLTCEPDDLRDPEEALRIALAVDGATGSENPRFLETLALAWHLNGNDARAIAMLNEALARAPEEDPALRDRLETRRNEIEHAAGGERG